MTFPSSPFPRSKFDGQPCTSYRADRPFKTIGIIRRCSRCNLESCAVPYYEWERRAPAGRVKPPRDFPILRSPPLWQPTWVDNPCAIEGWLSPFQELREGDSAAGVWVDGRWFPPLRCGPNGFGDERKTISGPSVLPRIFSSPFCRCSDCLRSAQAIEIMLVGIAYEAAKEWPEHRCWFGSLAFGTEVDQCTCGAFAVIGGTWWESECSALLADRLGWEPQWALNEGIAFSAMYRAV